MKKPLKVAIYSGVSKSTTFIERLILGLSNQGVKVLIFGYKNSKQLQLHGVVYHTYGGKFNKLFRLLKYTLLLNLFKIKEKQKLDEIIKTKNDSSRLLKLKYYPVLYHRPDIFHLQWAKALSDWIWVQEFGIQLILSLRGTHITISPITENYYKDMYLKLFSKVDAFHAVSKSTSNLAIKYGAESDKITVIKSGLNLDKLKFESKNKINDTLRILSIGRSHFTKGYSYAMDAMAILKDKNVKFHYTIIGVKDDESLLYQQSQLNLEDVTTFKETLPFNDVIDFIKKADIVLLPSLEEGIANVVLEAMALGTLVVSSDCGGMAEVVKNNETGFLVPKTDVNKIAEILQRISKIELQVYNYLVSNAYKNVEKNHSEDIMIAKMMNLYNQVLN